MSSESRKVESVAAHLAQFPEIVGLDRKYSFGTQGKTFVEEQYSNIKPGFKIQNDTNRDIIVLMIPDNFVLGDVKTDAAAILARTGADAILANGVILMADAVGLPGMPGKTGKVTVSSTDKKYRIDDFLRYVGRNSTQFVKWSLKSRKLSSGIADNSNYENSIESQWWNIFDKVQEDSLTLRDLQNSKMTAPEFAEINFLTTSFNALLSFEHCLKFQVNADTELVITSVVGAQDSAAQRFFRDTKKANQLLLPYRSNG